MTPAILRRIIQIAAFVFAAFGHRIVDIAPPGVPANIVVIGSVLVFIALTIVAAIAPARRTWLYLVIPGGVAGGVCGLWYQAAHDTSVFVYGHRTYVAGAELKPEAQDLIRENPVYKSPSKAMGAAGGDETAVWTPESIAHAKLKLNALYVATLLLLATSVFAAAEGLGARRAKQLILFLAANPRGTSELELTAECAAIEHELQRTGKVFDFQSKWAVTKDDVMRYLNDLRPTIVHFSGHGTAAGSGNVAIEDTRDIEAATQPAAGGALVLQDEQRAPQYIPAEKLAEMIGSASPATRLVVLNACYSDGLAAALLRVVEGVVGMSSAIGDPAARAFAVGFYRALGHRRTVGNAVKQARAVLTPPHDELPTARTRAGTDPNRLSV